AGSVSPMIIPPAAYRVTAMSAGYRENSVEVMVNEGSGTTEFAVALDPIAVLTVANFSLFAESCDINGTPEPGETVSASVTVRNDGAAAAAGVTGVLLSGGGIESTGTAKDFGTIEPGGTATQTFPFTVLGTVNCGAELRPMIRFTANKGPLGDISTTLTAGRRRVVFSENFDGVAAPALPAGWSTSTTENHQLWRTSTNRFESAGNAAFSPAPIQRGVNELVSPEFRVDTSDAEVRFRNWYELETTFLRNRLYDGAVLEIKIAGGDWQDILAAGGRFISGGYDGTIDACCNNPLAGRPGWSGRSGPNQTSIFIDTVAKLPASAAGNTVRLRWRVGTDIGTFREGQYLDNIVVTDGFACSCSPATNADAPFDFDGDGRTDLGTANLSEEVGTPDISILRSSDNTVSNVSFGSAADILAPADFDSDGRADVAIFRSASGEWWITESGTGNFRVVRFGLAGDIPLPNDHDGDGRADLVVYRPATGTWYILKSSDGNTEAVRFGLNADIPAPADFDGDGKADLAVFRPATGEWYVLKSLDSSVGIERFGLADDIPVVGDFDGDGRADIAVFRPAEGTWYLNRSRDGFLAVRFGLAGDRPLQGDLDGDGRYDIAVFRPSTAVWYTLQSSTGQASITAFGTPGSAPIPGVYVRP
ncbi:MAG: FG-GAP-like repeat-containing protein, partial [Pyrinomonadaceae bacterium]|nr:FG-GAP-like repeat-containing protein [Pyrinomonadaceae bacterium]